MSDAPKKILFIEDNPGDCRLIQEMIREAPGLRDFSFVNALSLAEGMRVLGEQPCDIVLLDLHLADSAGLDTFLRLKLDMPAELPVIVLTGMTADGIGVRAVRAGAQDYLPKGAINPELLERSILHAVERHLAHLEREFLIRELQQAMSKVKRLSGLLPICANCKKVRDDQGYWRQVEEYIRDSFDTRVTHGYCPECAEKFFHDSKQA